MLNPSSTIAASTEADYRKLVAMLRGRAIARQIDDPAPLDPRSASALAAELALAEPDLSAASARKYRAALLWDIRTREYRSDDVALAMTVLDRDESFEECVRKEELAVTRTERKTRYPVGAQQKALSLSYADIVTLLAALRSSASTYGHPTADWFASALVTGLRPIEWRTARREGSELHVTNAKNTQGRSFGKTRKLRLHKLGKDGLDCIDRHLATVAPHADVEKFPALYNGCRQLMRMTADRLWPNRSRHPSLYTGRHVFSAAAKSTWPPDQVAALMGHGSTDTAPRHYSSASDALGPALVEAHPDDVLLVRARRALDFIDMRERRAVTH